MLYHPFLKFQFFLFKNFPNQFLSVVNCLQASCYFELSMNSIDDFNIFFFKPNCITYFRTIFRNWGFKVFCDVGMTWKANFKLLKCFTLKSIQKYQQLGFFVRQQFINHLNYTYVKIDSIIIEWKISKILVTLARILRRKVKTLL